MANTLAGTLTRPRTDAWHAGQVETVVAVAATDTATAAPGPDTAYWSTGEIDTVRIFARYTGTVTSAAITLHVLQDGDWYYMDASTLDPSLGNALVDALFVGQQTRFAVQLSEVSGGGTVEIRILGVG